MHGMNSQVEGSDIPSYIDPSQSLKRILSSSGKLEKAPNLDDFRVDTAMRDIVDSLTNIKNSRSGYYHALDRLYSHYLCKLVIDVMSDDILRDTSQETLIEVKVKGNEKYDRDAKDLFEDFSIPALVDDILHDYLYYGEYPLWVETKDGEGVVDIVDKFDPKDVIGVYESRKPIAFYYLDEVSREYQFANPRNILHFVNNSRKVRIKLSETVPYSVRKALGSPIVRTGRSVIWSAIDKLQELNLKEKISLISGLTSLSRPTLVGLQLPASMAPDDIISVTQKYEKLLNNIPELITPDQEVALNELSQRASQIKVLPSFSDKGSLDKLRLNEELKDPIEKSDITDSRELVLSTIGVPSEFIFEDPGDSKRSNLRRYTRYTKKIKSHQKSIARALKLLVLTHLSVKHGDLELNEDDIEVTLYNPTNIEEIDDLEGTELALSTVQSVLRTLDDVKRTADVLDGDNEWFDKNELLRYMQRNLKDSGSRAHKVIKIPGEEDDTT